MADDETPEYERETKAVETHPETGASLVGDYPVNARARAEALARDDKSSDPAGLITDDLIADAAARLKREAKAEPKPRTRKADGDTSTSSKGA